MLSNLPNFIIFSLLFATSFCTKNNKKINAPFLENEIVQISNNFEQTFFNPNDIFLNANNNFLIYPRNDLFNNYILPYLHSSEILLDIYSKFDQQQVHIETFLPNSTSKVTVLDLYNSYTGYIFQEKYSVFNPIIFDFVEQRYRTVALGCRGDSDLYALFPSLNKISSLHCEATSKDKKLFLCVDELEQNPRYFFAAIENLKTEKFFPRANGSLIQNWRHWYQKYYLKAYDFNVLKKVYYKIFDLWENYHQKIWTYFSCVNNFQNYFDRNCPSFFLLKKLYRVFVIIFLYFIYFPVYHAQSMPFYLTALPFQIAGFYYTQKVTFLCTIPYFLEYLFFLSYWDLLEISHLRIQWNPEDVVYVKDMKTNPSYLKWAVLNLQYHQTQPFALNNASCSIESFAVMCIIFFFGFIYHFPFFFMLVESANSMLSTSDFE